MTDLLLDTTTHDIKLVGRDLGLVRGVDLVRQRLKQVLLSKVGEWFLDTEHGLPWYETIFAKGTPETVIRSLLIRAITGTAGVQELQAFDLLIDSNTRVATINFTVKANDEIIAIEETL